MTWLDASGGYQVRLDDRGKVVCRNAKGKQLATVPAALKEDGQVVQLRQLAEWLGRHETECHETVDRWMVRSLPVPTVVVVEVWPDPAWRNALRDLVVTVDDTAGFLRDADPERGVGVVTLDGESVGQARVGGHSTSRAARRAGGPAGVRRRARCRAEGAAAVPADVREG
ncbi:hypothetical protein GCM10029964_097930 [Kibdelosporangium lantanae]